MAVRKKYDRSVLGRGLDNIGSGRGLGLDALIDTHVITDGSSSINEVDITQIYANPDQPRHSFDEEALQELSDSIREHGVISPITLRKNEDGTYMIIAGERRFRASKMAGLTSIPAYIRTAKDEEVREWALIENIQREDLDAIEIALAYQRLMEDYEMTQEKMAERVGKKRTTVANYLRLLKLPAEIQMGIKEKKIDMGHARAILGSPSTEQQLALYKRILSDGLSVRRVEQLVADNNLDKKRQKSSADAGTYRDKETAVAACLNTKVKNPLRKIILILSLFAVLALQAQELLHSTPADSIAPDTITILSGVNDIYALGDTVQRPSDSLLRLQPWRPDPIRATWLAVIVPGLGQIYNRSYWKLPLVYGAFMGCIYAITWNNSQYQDYRQAYRDILVADELSADPSVSYNAILPKGYTIETMGGREQYTATLNSKQNLYRRYRDISIAATAIVYILSIIDAYVDAQLFDFDISTDLSLNVSPEIYYDPRLQQRNAGVHLAFTF